MAQGINFGERYIASDIARPDFAALAQACGALGLTVNRVEELDAALDAALANPGPSVINLFVDPDEMLPIKARTILMAKRMGLNLSDSREAARAFRKVLDER